MSAIPSDLCCFVFAIASFVIALAWLRQERSRKIGDLPILATCQPGTLTMFSNEVNSPVAHGRSDMDYRGC